MATCVILQKKNTILHENSLKPREEDPIESLLRETIEEMKNQLDTFISEKETLSTQIKDILNEHNVYKYALEQSQISLKESENRNTYLQHIYDEKIYHLEIHARQQSMNYELLSDHKLKSDTAFTTKLSELENIIS